MACRSLSCIDEEMLGASQQLADIAGKASPCLPVCLHVLLSDCVSMPCDEATLTASGCTACQKRAGAGSSVSGAMGTDCPGLKSMTQSCFGQLLHLSTSLVVHTQAVVWPQIVQNHHGKHSDPGAATAALPLPPLWPQTCQQRAETLRLRCRSCPQRCWLTLARCSAAKAPSQQRSFKCPQPSCCAPFRCDQITLCRAWLLTVAMEQPAAPHAEHLQVQVQLLSGPDSWCFIFQLSLLLMAAPADPIKGMPVLGAWVSPCNLDMLCTGPDGGRPVTPLLTALQRPAPWPGYGTAASSAVPVSTARLLWLSASEPCVPTAGASCKCALDVPPAGPPHSASQHCCLCLLQKFPAAAERIQGAQVDQPPAMAELLSDMRKV